MPGPDPRRDVFERNVLDERTQLRVLVPPTLIVSELATNALLHGAIRGRLFRVHLTLTEFVLRVAVRDPRGERLPCLRQPDGDDRYGRGLLIVAQLADRWGVEPRTVGKSVFAELSVR
ncbi:ATP-binding protein [Streptomyces sp. CA-146814]|uniref:ATP-binding protein n=1 Tax=Streptomyces sp. CA-146814 TaxID=3240053 RepID=UPI003D912551